MDSLDPLPLSALQHWRYCPRQRALIHLEQAFENDVFTLRCQAVHARTDQPGVDLRAGPQVERPLPVWSGRLGLIGKADVVEFQPEGTPARTPNDQTLPGRFVQRLPPNQRQCGWR